MAAETVRRSLALHHELHGGAAPVTDLVLNGAMDDGEIEALVARASHDGTAFRQVLRLPEDPLVAACDREARSLLDLSGESAAVGALAAWEVSA
jgi:hypothetical protein